MKASDVVVIGGGISGMMAAIAAAKKGKSVTMLRYGYGAFEIGGGLIDIMAYPNDKKSSSSLKNCIGSLSSDHPYSKLGLQRVEDAVKFLLDLTKEEGYAYEGGVEELHWVPTAVGTMKPTGLYPKSFDVEVLKKADTIYLVDFKGLKDYYAKLTEKTLKKLLGEDKKYEIVTVDPKMEEAIGGRDIMIMDIARWLDKSEGQEDCASQLKALVKPGAAVVFPQVLGTMPSYAAYDKMKSALQCDVTEALCIPPSAAGMRLSKLLHNAARKYGVKIIEKARVKSAVVKGGVCESVIASGVGREHTYAGKSFILATGGYYSGGLEVLDNNKVLEPIFNLPVKVMSQKEDEWANLEMFSDKKQPFALAGVTVNYEMCPVNENGEKVLKNVFVTGRNLCGYDFCFEKSGNGVALASAYQAAASAMEVK